MSEWMNSAQVAKAIGLSTTRFYELRHRVSASALLVPALDLSALTGESRGVRYHVEQVELMKLVCAHRVTLDQALEKWAMIRERLFPLNAVPTSKRRSA